MSSIVIAGDTSGSVTLQAPAVSGSSVLSLPAVTDTVAGIAATQTLTNKTLTAPTIASANLTTALTLTGASGTNGQVLTSGGSAAAPTWTTVSGSSQWTTDGSNINYTTGSIGVGVTNYPAIINAKNATNNSYGYHIRQPDQSSSTSNAGWYWGADNNGDTYFAYNNGATYTNRLRININGNVVLQGGTTSANGVGITFPATQSASSDANTLDDYEEGNWTPAIEFDGASVGVTYNGATGGRYVKIGKTVWVFGGLFLTNKGSSTGSTVKITGLPFAVSSSGETGNFSMVAGNIENITYSGTLALWGGSGGNPRFVSIASNSTPTQLSDTAFANTSSIVLNFCYQTSN